MKYKTFFRYVKIFIILLFILLFFIWTYRMFSPKELDDVNPNFICSNENIKKADILMVIPIFDNVSIADNSTWCNYILSLNKTIGMHGVYHTYNEFLEVRDKEYIQEGIDEFTKCFNQTPVLFQPPQVALNSKNIPILESLNLKVSGKTFQIFHKVYHCNLPGAHMNGFIKYIYNDRFMDLI